MTTIKLFFSLSKNIKYIYLETTSAVAVLIFFVTYSKKKRYCLFSEVAIQLQVDVTNKFSVFIIDDMILFR